LDVLLLKGSSEARECYLRMLVRSRLKRSVLFPLSLLPSSHLSSSRSGLRTSESVEEASIGQQSP